ncbi:MAG TPA: hypothetical protein VMB05_10215 [Solirubrobacteraceae bacterium]|nr:hypothetical protein [Solirubrobacteraceae bacterium]
MNVAPRFIETGESTVVFGQLSCPTGANLEAQPVTVYGRSAGGSSGLAMEGTTSTDPTGHFQVTTPALNTNTQLYATVGEVRSTNKIVKVSPKVMMTTAPPDGSQLFTGGGPLFHSHAHRLGFTSKVVFGGTVSPEDEGAVVALQRESSVGSEEWHSIDRSRVGQGGTYSIIHTFAVPGDANIRVIVRAHGLNAPGASEPVSYEISQAQNPALMIESSADPISFGQPVTISGKTTAPAGAQLTLLSRTRLQHGFTAVATTTSGGDGSYSFPAQTPNQSTFYKVTGAGKTSSRLFEGVRYGLTASASASSVQAGSSVIFSGTVTPGHENHPVYLQVQNPSGIGFHTVEVAQVTGTSTFSISHTFYAAISRKLRVKVPGDPENQGVASQLLGVEVTPAPAAALMPEPPGNSTPPGEGHI